MTVWMIFLQSFGHTSASNVMFFPKCATLRAWRGRHTWPHMASSCVYPGKFWPYLDLLRFQFRIYFLLCTPLTLTIRRE